MKACGKLLKLHFYANVFQETVICLQIMVVNL